MAPDGSTTSDNVVATMPPPSAQVAAASHDSNGVPFLVSPNTDLVAKAGTEQDSWFVICNLDSERGTLNVLVHYIRVTPPEGESFTQAIISMLDPATRRYIAEERDYPSEECTFSQSELHVANASGDITGDASSMHVTANFNELAVDLTLSHDGPVLANLGTGLLPFYDNINYEFALPNMATVGTLSYAGHTYNVSGTSWFDRQWGLQAPTFWAHRKWAWFGVSLDDGRRLSIWDITDDAAGTEHAFATLLHPDGRMEIASVEPVGQRASRSWKSDQSGQVYPTKFEIHVPQMDGVLSLQPEVREQEVFSPVEAHKYEGATAVEGHLGGRDVSGRAVIELVGNWV